MNKSNPGSMQVARPRQRRNKPAGHSLECRGRGFLFSEGGEGRGKRNDEVGPCRAPLLASCSWPGWLFSHVLAHGPVAESGPQAFALVGDGSTAIRHGPVPRLPCLPL